MSLRKYLVLVFILSGFAILFSCKSTSVSQNIQVDEGNPVVAEQLSIPLDSSEDCFAEVKRKATVLRFYMSRGGRSAWFNIDSQFTELADSMMQFIQRSDAYALNASDYHQTTLTNDAKSDVVRKDVLLTDAFLSMSSDLKYGRSSLLNNKGYDSVGVSLLNQVLIYGKLAETLESQEPDFFQYRTLKSALRNILDSLNACKGVDSAEKKNEVQDIQFNMERWRQERASFANRYVYINIPSFMLQIIQGDTVIFSSKIIVGATETPTPEITSAIECFTIYPYWQVPRKISVGEYLPMIQKDSTFIFRNNFDVLDRKGKVLDADSVEWERFHKNYFPVILRQREGEENALGIVKFLFDNPYAVYLHDTNARRLFRSSRRAFSHGCIRIEKAVAFAHYLTTGKLNTKSPVVDRYLQEKKRQTINLKSPMPIYIRYYTADVVDGSLTLHEDIYQKKPQTFRSNTDLGATSQK